MELANESFIGRTCTPSDAAGRRFLPRRPRRAATSVAALDLTSSPPSIKFPVFTDCDATRVTVVGGSGGNALEILNRCLNAGP